MILLEIDPAAFRIVTQSLNQLNYRVWNAFSFSSMGTRHKHTVLHISLGVDLWAKSLITYIVKFIFRITLLKRTDFLRSYITS